MRSIRRAITRLGASVAALSGVAAPLGASAISMGNLPPVGAVPSTQVTTISDIYVAVCAVKNWLTVFGVAIGVIFIIWGGIRYITSAGDETKAEAGKKTIVYSLGGVIFLILAMGIVSIVADYFGTSFSACRICTIEILGICFSWRDI